MLQNQMTPQRFIETSKPLASCNVIVHDVEGVPKLLNSMNNAAHLTHHSDQTLKCVQSEASSATLDHSCPEQ